MRSIIAIFLLFSLQASAQECKLNRTADPYTKEKRISSGFVQLEGGSVTIDASKPEIDILFSIEGADKCYDNNSTAYIFFEGSKSKASVRNGGTMNCEGLFHFIFRNSNSVTTLLNRMMTQKITHIVFTGNNKKETTITFGPLEQDAVKNFAACVVNEAKLLLQ
jgi:hypothetical protein